MAGGFRKKPFFAMNCTLTRLVEYTSKFGPPAIGSMKANEDAKVTARRKTAGS